MLKMGSWPNSVGWEERGGVGGGGGGRTSKHRALPNACSLETKNMLLGKSNSPENYSLQNRNTLPCILER